MRITSGATVTLDNLQMVDGSAPIDAKGGGAIDNAGEVTVKRTVFSDNRASSSSSHGGFGGGAIYNSGKLTVELCTFSFNQTDGSFGGGAIYNAGALKVSKTLSPTTSPIVSSTAVRTAAPFTMRASWR